jgi:hypothetical protein
MIVGTIEPVAGNAALGNRRNDGMPAACCACCALVVLVPLVLAVGAEGALKFPCAVFVAAGSGFELVSFSGVSATGGD